MAGPAENANGAPTFISYSFYDLFYSQQQLLEGQKPAIDPALFKDRIVVVGVNAEGLHEMFTTPFPLGRDQRPRSARQRDRRDARQPVDRASASVGRRLRSIAAGARCVGMAGRFLNAWLTGAVALVVGRAVDRDRRWRCSRAACGFRSRCPRSRSSSPSSAISPGSISSRAARSG